MRLGRDQEFGLKWEVWALGQLHKHGYTEARLVSNYFSDRDIMLGTMPIEVKAANPKQHWANCQRTRWQFDTSRLLRQIDHVVILIAIDDERNPYPFIVPSWLIGDRYNIHITSHPVKYRGLFAPCLFRWGNVGTTRLIHQHYQGQATLPGLGTGDSAEKITEWGQKSGSASRPPELSPFPIGETV